MSTPSIESQIIEQLIAQIQKDKERLIKERLEAMGVSYLLAFEKERRFKKIVCEIKGDEETYYYNDNTPEGQRIITFIHPGDPYFAKAELGSFKIETELKYF